MERASEDIAFNIDKQTVLNRGYRHVSKAALVLVFTNMTHTRDIKYLARTCILREYQPSYMSFYLSRT